MGVVVFQIQNSVQNGACVNCCVLFCSENMKEEPLSPCSQEIKIEPESSSETEEEEAPAARFQGKLEASSDGAVFRSGTVSKFQT